MVKSKKHIKKGGLYIMKLKRVLSLVMVLVLLAGLCLSLAGCGEPETATYTITNTTPNTVALKWIRKVKIQQQWSDIKPGDVLEITMDIHKKDPNILSVFFGGFKVGRDVITPENGFVDGGKYYIIIFRTPGASKDEYKIVPDDGSYVKPAQ
jgi:hypothetical protein